MHPQQHPILPGGNNLTEQRLPPAHILPINKCRVGHHERHRQVEVHFHQNDPVADADGGVQPQWGENLLRKIEHILHNSYKAHGDDLPLLQIAPDHFVAEGDVH